MSTLSTTKVLIRTMVLGATEEVVDHFFSNLQAGSQLQRLKEVRHFNSDEMAYTFAGDPSQHLTYRNGANIRWTHLVCSLKEQSSLLQSGR